MATGMDLVNAAREVLGAPYRVWYEGASIPMWLDDGFDSVPAWWWIGRAGTPPGVGIECFDLINYALEHCGLPAIGGTTAITETLEQWEYFDPSAPAVPGAVAVTPYEGPALNQRGHVLLYTGAHSTIQALVSDGVTEDYSDIETAGFLELRYYGLLPGVDYSDVPSPAAGTVPIGDVSDPKWVAINSDGVMVANGPDCARGWYDTGWRRGDWSWHGPKEK